MKKILLFSSLLILTGCAINQNTSKESLKSSIQNITVSIVASSEDISIKECDFEMDLSLYKIVNKQYEYYNEFGQGIVMTNKIYITCIFNFNRDINLNQSFILTVNKQKVFSQDYNYLEKTIEFKIEDPNWSNEY